MLNVVNGILFIQIREKDLDLLRQEFSKQSSVDGEQATTPAVTTVSAAAEQAAALMNNEVD